MSIKKGDTGKAVESLQNALTRNGFNCTIDGDFGKKTLVALIAYQKSKNLTPDGIAGEKTLKALGVVSTQSKKTLVTAQQCLDKYGDPHKEAFMTTWQLPESLQKCVIPRKIYCNVDMVHPLSNALSLVVQRGLSEQIVSWDGCFNIRQKRGQSASYSLHSWGVAIDINAHSNPFGKSPAMSLALVQCFKDAGFDWGGDWSAPDGMHFQLGKL